MLCFEVDTLEDNLGLGPYLTQCSFPKECCLSERSKKACQKCGLRRPPTNLDPQTCFCVCVGGVDWRWGQKRGERNIYERIIAT